MHADVFFRSSLYYFTGFTRTFYKLIDCHQLISILIWRLLFELGLLDVLIMEPRYTGDEWWWCVVRCVALRCAMFQIQFLNSHFPGQANELSHRAWLMACQTSFIRHRSLTILPTSIAYFFFPLLFVSHVTLLIVLNSMKIEGPQNTAKFQWISVFFFSAQRKFISKRHLLLIAKEPTFLLLIEILEFLNFSN